MPALVVRGDEDGLASADDATAMVEALPEGRLVTLPGAGHLSNLEVPDAFSRTVADFLAALGTR